MYDEIAQLYHLTSAIGMAVSNGKPLSSVRSSVQFGSRARCATCRWPRDIGLIVVVLHGLLLVVSPIASASEDANRPAVAASELVSGGLVDIQPALGFSSTFRLGRWTPLTVMVNNRGSDLVGHLEVQVTEGDVLQDNLFTTSHRRRLELPRDSRKRFRFTVLLEIFSHPIVIRVTTGGREVARHTIELRHRFTTGRLVLVLSRDADLDYLNDDARDSLRVLYPHPALLPDRWQGYDGVEALVIHGVTLEQLSARQFEALKRWLAHGGTLAVSGGPDYALLRTPRLAELLPATPIGLVQIADATAVGEALGTDIDAPRPFDVNRLAGVRGRTLARAGEIPLLVQAESGYGRVLYLTFDVARYPFAGWPGMKALWSRTLGLAREEPAPPRVTHTRDKNPAVALVRARSTSFPGQGTVFVFLALYVGVIATGYRLRPSAKALRRVQPWLTWAPPVVFAPIAYLLFGPLLYPGGATAVAVTVVKPHPQGSYADLTLDVGMYSTRASPLRLHYEGAEPGFRPVPHARAGNETADWVFDQGTGMSAQPADRRRYVLHVLEGRDVVRYDMHASARQTEQGLRLRLTNDSGRALGDALVVFQGRAHWLGAVAEGADLERALRADPELLELEAEAYAKLLRRVDGWTVHDVEAVESVLERELRESGHARFDEALLMGLSTSPLRVASAGTAWRRRELALVLMRVPVSLLPKPETFRDESL